MRVNPSLKVLAISLALWHAGAGTAAADDATAELPAGGLAFVPASALAKESEELALSRERIRITYTIRNTSARDIALWVSFPLPDIDMMAVGDQEVLFPSPDPTSFVEHETLVDGVRVEGKTRQSAFAAHRDVTQILHDHSIPLFPFADDVASTLGDLSRDERREFQEQGIMRHDTERAEPGWTLKTTFSWRQVFPAGKAIRIAHSYRPIPSVRTYRPGDLKSLARSHCIDGAIESALAQRSGPGQEPVELLALTYLAAPSATWWGKTGDLRLAIEKQTPSTIVATCWRGLRAAGPTLLEWSGHETVIEDDVHVLFIR